MKLYFSPGACSLAPHILLREVNAKFDLVKVNLETHKTEQDEDYYAINPNGQVPFLELPKGGKIAQGAVIAQYIAEHANAETLLPTSGAARYEILQWQTFITTELHKSFTPLFNPSVPAETKNIFRDQLRKKYEWINQQLRGKPYLANNHFSVADAYLFVVSNWGQYVGLDLGDLQALQSYLSGIASRPSVKAAMAAEGLAA